MKRFAPGLVAAGLLAVGVSQALAATTIVAPNAADFMDANSSQDQGETESFSNVNFGTPHNVTAAQNGPDGKALFRTPTITGGIVPVDGTKFLFTGVYGFFCSVHPNMQATLTVSNLGSPVPRPAATAKVLTKSIGAGKIKTQVTGIAPTGAPGGTIVAKLGSKVLTKSTTFFAGPGASTKVNAKLTNSGKNKLRSRSSAKIKVTVTPDFGSPVTVKKRLK